MAYIRMLCTRMYILVFLFSIPHANVLTNVGFVRTGEKLSIQQLQNSKTIKNLRAKLKENDHLLAAQR